MGRVPVACIRKGAYALRPLFSVLQEAPRRVFLKSILSANRSPKKAFLYTDFTLKNTGPSADDTGKHGFFPNFFRENPRNPCGRGPSFMPPQRRHADARRQAVRVPPFVPLRVPIIHERGCPDPLRSPNVIQFILFER